MQIKYLVSFLYSYRNFYTGELEFYLVFSRSSDHIISCPELENIVIIDYLATIG